MLRKRNDCIIGLTVRKVRSLSTSVGNGVGGNERSSSEIDRPDGKELPSSLSSFFSQLLVGEGDEMHACMAFFTPVRSALPSWPRR